MFRVRQRKTRSERRIEAQGKALVGMVDAAMIIACADGELTDEELTVVGQVIDGFFDGNVTRNEINEMMNLSVEAIERDGIEGRMEAVAENLPTMELRSLALAAAAAVALSNEEGDEDEEDATYYALAEALDVDEDDAEKIFEEVEAQYA